MQTNRTSHTKSADPELRYSLSRLGTWLSLTSRALLLPLDPLPAIQLSEGLGRLLQFGDEELNVVQEVI